MDWSRTLDSQRGRAVNPTTNAAWFGVLTRTAEETQVETKDFYASDEAAFTGGHGTRQRVIRARGKGVQHQQRSGDRETMTVLDTICADGRSLPPTVIYKGQHFLTSWKQNNPLGYSKKGWMTGTISIEWIKHFDAQTRETANGKAHMLLVDGHVTHYTCSFLEYAREHNIHVLCYPAHATHVYQGLNVALFGPLKTAYGQERDRWEREKHEKVSKKNFLKIYGRAHVRVMTPENVRAVFRASGSWPINPAAITPQMLAMSRETSWQAHMPLPQPTPVR
ncbi:DDE-domain-containing protein, partial [Exidia glandulosa HHB12029]